MKTILIQLWTQPKALRKFIGAVLTGVLELVGYGLTPPGLTPYVLAGVAILGALGIYATNNEPLKPGATKAGSQKGGGV